MIGFPLNPSPPMARVTVAGKFGGFLQVDAAEARLMTSQMSVLYPPQISSLEKPSNRKIICKARLVMLDSVRSALVRLGWVRLGYNR